MILSRHNMQVGWSDMELKIPGECDPKAYMISATPNWETNDFFYKVGDSIFPDQIGTLLGRQKQKQEQKHSTIKQNKTKNPKRAEVASNSRKATLLPDDGRRGMQGGRNSLCFTSLVSSLSVSNLSWFFYFICVCSATSMAIFPPCFLLLSSTIVF